MPRRNIFWLVVLSAVSLICYLKVDRYGRVLVYALNQIDQRYLGEVEPSELFEGCLLYTSPSPRDRQRSRMPSSA